MASKEFYHDIDLVNVGQLITARAQNVTNASMSTLAGTLGVANKGLFVYNTDTGLNYTWSGTAFVADALNIVGDMIFRGVITDLSDPANVVSPANGDQYAIGTAGTLTITGVTFTPSAVVEVGDMVLFDSATTAHIIQRNDVTATDSVSGNVTLATQAEVNAGTESSDVVTPATLQGKLVAQGYVKQYFATVTTVANTPLTITHNLNLVDRNAFTINVMNSSHSQVSVDIDSVGVNSLTITTTPAQTDLKVTIQGASAA